MNGGDCKEICNPKGARFNCTCPGTHTGHRCKIKYARSCKDVAENDRNLTSGNYIIYDSTMETFPVYCDMESEAGFVWTLIQSFSLGNKGTFEDKGFGVDFPKNDAKSYVDWTAYRLSLSHMQSVASHSTHLRVTCNYPTEGNMHSTFQTKIKIPLFSYRTRVLSSFSILEHYSTPRALLSTRFLSKI